MSSSFVDLSWEIERKQLFLVLILFICLMPLPATAASLTREQVLLTATEKGDYSGVDYILSRGANVNAKDSYGWTPLMNAASAGRIDIAKLLLANGANLELRDNGGTTALGLAAAKGREEMVTLLLEKGANINAKDGKGLDALMMSAKGGFLSLTKTLLDKGANIYLSDNDGNTVLMLAAKGAHTDVVNLVLERGARIPTVGKDGEQLMVAAIKGDLNQIKNLLDQGADPGAKTVGGGSRSAMFWAASMGNTDVVKYFLNSEALATAETNAKNQTNQKPKKLIDDTISFAASNGKLNVVKLLLENLRDPNSKDKEGNTGLTLAAEYGHTDVVELLLANGADRNYKNSDGDSALIIAVKERHPEVVKTLITNWADLETRDKKGKTPLIHAVLNDDSDIATQFLEKKVKVDARDNEGWPALHIAAKNGYEKLTQLLCDHGADVNTKITQGSKSPLMLAASNGKTSTAKTLLEKGASVNAVDYEGSNSLFLASEAGYGDTVSLLLDHGADYNAESREGVTPLMAAAFQGRLKVVELLMQRGVPIDARSKKQGFSALWTAAMNGKNDVIDFLWKNGADINVKSKKNVSPLVVAVQNGQFDTLRMLLDKGVDQDIQDVNRQSAMDIARKSGQFHMAWLLSSYNRLGVRALGDKKGGLFGVQVQDLNDALAKSFGRETADGVLVVNVLPGTPAQSSNVRDGDIILRVNDEAVKGAAQFSNMIEAEKPGSSVNLMAYRNGQYVTITSKLAERPIRDFYEAMLKYNPRGGAEYVIYPPTRVPKDPNYYLFQGKIYSGSNSRILVERQTNNYNEGKYWAFDLPAGSGFSARVKTEVMVIGKIVDVMNGETLIRKPLHWVVIKPVAIADANGNLITFSAQ